MLSGPSTRRHVIFDGTDRSISFLDFIRRLESSPDWIDMTAFSVSKDMEQVVPTHLYGEALRYYEALDPDCQQHWSQLRDVMARRFPGAIRSGGLVRRSPTQWEEDGLPTMAESPPLTSSKLAVPDAAIDVVEEPTSPEDVLRHKTSCTFIFSKSQSNGNFTGMVCDQLAELIRDLAGECLFKEPYVTVHSMFIQYAHGGTKWKPISTSLQVEVDLTDPLAVAAAKKAPLITIPSNDDSERYLVGFTYNVLRGHRFIDFCHKVLAPRKFKTDYLQLSGQQTVSPTRQLSQAYSVTDFVYNHNNPYTPRKRPPTGTYTIQSHLKSRMLASEIEILGEITWILEIV
ncbi:hypothetical protein M407DRAFT_32024 [Tulasnella calospora MUT 4182]|uniref:Uncharacterized protein n=1 Tax=Tulasnella calospora MUT 4182 TaxID=1051891 RepID=A0A0C3Q4Q1_9AGAM|nr:hypothetical protein M407DRAFT_32024 [Tulasnella calospora MUT 4182]